MRRRDKEESQRQQQLLPPTRLAADAKLPKCGQPVCKLPNAFAKVSMMTIRRAEAVMRLTWSDAGLQLAELNSADGANKPTMKAGRRERLIKRACKEHKGARNEHRGSERKARLAHRVVISDGRVSAIGSVCA